jgi:hypothetical protein
MASARTLIISIRMEFDDVSFPFHCGLNAAVAKDDWIDDEETLKEITKQRDYIGKWWEVPRDQLLLNMMALSYFDAPGMAFYLPAYMTAVLEEPEKFDVPGVRSSAWEVVHTFLPNEDDQDLKELFLEQFSLFNWSMKHVCREFLVFVANASVYNEHARRIATEALAHEYWSNES